MNILFIKHFFVGCMVSEISRVSVFGYFPLHIVNYSIYIYIYIYIYIFLRVYLLTCPSYISGSIRYFHPSLMNHDSICISTAIPRLSKMNSLSYIDPYLWNSYSPYSVDINIFT